MNSNTVISALDSVTKKWTKQRKAEERNASRRCTRVYYYHREYAYIKEAVWERMEEAIAKASGGGLVEFPARNLFYAMRALIQDANTNRPLDAKYFDALIKQYEEEQGEISGMYRDPRGVFIEPHTGNTVPLGTREVNGYGVPKLLYNKLLYVEKKGFAPIFQHYQIPAKYDLAIASSEGYAVNAAKTLFQRAGNCDITILCLHDADPWGYNICRALEEAVGSVIDIGLHLEEAFDMGLPAESFSMRRAPSDSGWPGGNQRVEINALAADPQRFIEWLEGKLEEHGLKRKLIPEQDAIFEHAEEAITKKLTETIRGHVEELVDLDAITEALIDEYKPKIKVKGLPRKLATWGKKLEPKPWRDHADGIVAGLIGKFDDKLEAAVNDAVQEAIL